MRVDKLQNRAWNKASLPALAFLEEVAALYQQRAAAGRGRATPAASGSAPDIQAIWERDWWLRKGRRVVDMRLNTVKMVPVRLDDYLTDELRALSRKCLSTKDTSLADS